MVERQDAMLDVLGEVTLTMQVLVNLARILVNFNIDDVVLKIQEDFHEDSKENIDLLIVAYCYSNMVVLVVHDQLGRIDVLDMVKQEELLV